MSEINVVNQSVVETQRSDGDQLEAAVDLRRRAQAVLESLRDAKRKCDQHLASANRSDAMRQVTGRSSFDLAIASAERTIAALDRLHVRGDGLEGA
jgi:hypothetical protein